MNIVLFIIMQYLLCPCEHIYTFKIHYSLAKGQKIISKVLYHNNNSNQNSDIFQIFFPFKLFKLCSIEVYSKLFGASIRSEDFLCPTWPITFSIFFRFSMSNFFCLKVIDVIYVFVVYLLVGSDSSTS